MRYFFHGIAAKGTLAMNRTMSRRPKYRVSPFGFWAMSIVGIPPNSCEACMTKTIPLHRCGQNLRLDHHDPEGNPLLSNDGSFERHFFPFFGARCDSANPAAILDARLVLGFLSTREAAWAALGLVRRCFGRINLSLVPYLLVRLPDESRALIAAFRRI